MCSVVWCEGCVGNLLTGGVRESTDDRVRLTLCVEVEDGSHDGRPPPRPASETWAGSERHAHRRSGGCSATLWKTERKRGKLEGSSKWEFTNLSDVGSCLTTPRCAHIDKNSNAVVKLLGVVQSENTSQLSWSYEARGCFDAVYYLRSESILVVGTRQVRNA